MLIASELDGEAGYFVFDTGADAIVINRETDINDVISFETITGTISTTRILVNKIKIGNYVVNDVDAYAYDLSSIEKFTNKNLLGIIGTKFLEGEVLFIDNVNNVIQILDRKLVKNTSGQQFIRSKIWIENGIPIVPLKIGDKEYKFGLDTGSSVSIISNHVISSNPTFFTDNLMQIEVYTIDEDSTDDQRTVTADSVQFGMMSIENLQFGITDLEAINSELETKLDGIISLNQIPIKKIYIDLKNSQILMLP